MQDHLSYKINCVINNWFDSTYSDLDYDAIASGTITETFYCAGCTTRKRIGLKVEYKDSRSRTMYKCKDCMSKTSKEVVESKHESLLFNGKVVCRFKPVIRMDKRKHK